MTGLQQEPLQLSRTPRLDNTAYRDQTGRLRFLEDVSRWLGQAVFQLNRYSENLNDILRLALAADNAPHSVNGLIETAADKTYVLDHSAAFRYRIEEINIITASGTITAKVQIAAVDVTGLMGLSVSSTNTQASATADADRVVAVGDQVTLVTTSNAAALDLAWTMKTTRLLSF